MKVSSFFSDVLRAPLKNSAWSWGATDASNRVFLRVWVDEIKKLNDGKYVVVAVDNPRRKSNGYPERLRHLVLMRDGAQAFGIVCRAVDPKTDGVRRIAEFNQTELIQLGSILTADGRTYARIDGRVPLDDVTATALDVALIEDVTAILADRKIESTTKKTLVLARVGQGNFRTQVLQLWNKRCAVTQATTREALRASHIKPWRRSSNQERLDPQNGLPLVANLDALFDAGLITFEASGKILVSSRLSESERQIFGLNKSLAKVPSAKTAAYLAYHRETHFTK